MRKLAVVFFLVCLSSSLWAQDEMFKSLFIYNFTKNIEWPAEYQSGDFIITILGNSPIVGELEKISRLKKVGAQPIVIQKVNDASEIGKCNLIYITPSKSSQLSAILTTIEKKPIVIVGDKDGLAAAGAGLNFVKIEGKQKFEINTTALQRNGLKVNSYLSTLGIEVN